MRSALIAPLPLLGSLGVHAAIALRLFLALRHGTRGHEPREARPDVWVGTAVEVDAVATEDEAANPAGGAARMTATEAAAAPATARVAPQISPPATRTTPEDVAVEPARPRSSPARVASRQASPQSTHTQRSAASSSSAASDHAARSSAAVGAFGGEGLPPGVRSLPSAFTRAIPAATAADPIWQTLPVGVEHAFSIAIETDDDGRIADAEILKEKDGSEPEAPARHLRQRVIALLGAGQFALQNAVAGGRAVFRLTITLSDESVSEDELGQLPKKGFEAPSGSRPGRAYFTLVSGRHFEAKVQALTVK